MCRSTFYMTENLSKSLNLIIVVHIQVFCLWTGNTWMTKKICTLINYILIPYKKVFSLCPHTGTRELSRAYSFFFFLKILFLEKGEGREKERERNINMWLPLVHRTKPATRYVPWPGTEPATFWSMRWHYNQLSHTSRE